MFVAALFDPHPLLRLGLARIVGSISSIGEVQPFEPGDLASPGELSLPGSMRSLSADILLFGLSGSEALDRRYFDAMLERVAPRHVLLLSDDPRLVGPRHPLVAGRVRKSAPTDLIEAAVRLILAGGRCFPANVEHEGRVAADQATVAATPVPQHLSEDAGPQITPQDVVQGARSLRITPRQFEILMLRARGLSMKAVGQRLHISEATVKAHASSMYRRLDVANCQEAVQFALRKGVHLHLAPGHAPAQDEAADE